MSKMYLMTGLIGSGKSTYAAKISQKLEEDAAKEGRGFKWLDIDKCYALVNGDETIHTNKFKVWLKFYEMVYEAFENNCDVLIDTNAPTYTDRALFLDMFYEFDEHNLIWVNAAVDFAWKNNLKRKRQVPKDVFEKFVQLYEAPVKYERTARVTWDNIIRVDSNEAGFEEHVMLKKGE